MSIVLFLKNREKCMHTIFYVLVLLDKMWMICTLNFVHSAPFIYLATYRHV